MLDIQTEECEELGWGGLFPPCVHAVAESWSVEASDRRHEQPQRESTHNPASDFPILGSKPAALPARRVHRTSQHPRNKFLLLASAGLSRQLLLATKPLPN